MNKTRRFFIVSVPATYTKAGDVDLMMTEDFNARAALVLPADIDVHLIGTVAIDGRLVCMFREYDPRTKGGPR